MTAAPGQPLLMQGNEACVEGALAAGLNFYAGYPITPSTEIAELAAQRLPLIGGKFIQMEDEISSMAAVIGASLAGSKAMTATSGPGFSLKQENIGYALMAEVPCVIVNVQRMGPSTGIATAPAQGDVMQARWGTHGDHPMIVLSPSSVEETFYLTVKAFNFSERYRTPVILLMDEVIAHMRERVVLPSPEDLALINRRKPSDPPGKLKPEDYKGDEVRPLAAFGDGYRFHVTGLTHDHTGFPISNPDTVSFEMDRMHKKIYNHQDDISIVEKKQHEDAELLIVAYGCMARPAARAIKMARSEGIKVGLIRPVTLWPFPEKEIDELAASGKNLLVTEMNYGQLRGEVERVAAGRVNIHGLSRVNGELVTPDEILQKIREVA